MCGSPKESATLSHLITSFYSYPKHASFVPLSEGHTLSSLPPFLRHSHFRRLAAIDPLPSLSHRFIALMDDWQIKETLARLVGWTIVPSFATYLLQTIWYKLRSQTAPRKGSTTYTLHSNRIFCALVLYYLVHLIIDVCQSLKPTYYDALDLQFHGFSHKQLKRNFRRASMQFHPDKVGLAGTGKQYLSSAFH